MQPDYKKQFAIAHSTPSGVPDFNFGTPTVPNANGATSPAKDAYVANVAKSTAPTVAGAGSPGSYQGTVINAGTDAQVSAQMAAIDAARGGSTTGGTTPPPTDTPAPVKSAADTSFETYLQSLQQPEEVTAQTEYLNKLNLQSKLDQEKALASGETLGFATGEAQRVARNNALYLEAAGNTLDALVAKNASKSTIAKARFDYEQAKLKTQEDKNKGFELGPGQVRYDYDPKTGKPIKVASVPPNPTTSTAPGTTRSGGLVYSPQAAAEDSQALEASRGADHYVDPNVYLQLYQAWVAAGGLQKDFLTKYPPKGYVNPANTFLPTYLMPKLTAAEKEAAGVRSL